MEGATTRQRSGAERERQGFTNLSSTSTFIISVELAKHNQKDHFNKERKKNVYTELFTPLRQIQVWKCFAVFKKFQHFEG